MTDRGDQYKADVGALWEAGRAFVEHADWTVPEPIPAWDDLPEHDQFSFANIARHVLPQLGGAQIRMTQPPNVIPTIVADLLASQARRHTTDPLSLLPPVDEPPC